MSRRRRRRWREAAMASSAGARGFFGDDFLVLLHCRPLLHGQNDAAARRRHRSMTTTEVGLDARRLENNHELLTTTKRINQINESFNGRRQALTEILISQLAIGMHQIAEKLL